jgi:cellulose synthase/poly-beta-1,6-N-acetylglucosamine synthase-like glycosyltransferase
VRPFQEKEIELTYGPRTIKNPNFNFLTKAQIFFIDLNNLTSKISQQLKLRYMCPGENMAFRKSVWKKFKFRNVVSEDTDFGHRIFKSGMKVYFVENAKVKIRVPLNLSDLRYQQIRWLHESYLDLKLFSFWILYIFSFLFPTFGLVTLIYLIFVKSNLLIALFFSNVVLFVLSYLMICLRTSIKNFINGLYLLSLNLFYFSFVIEAILRMIFKSKIKWIEYKY